LADLESDSLLLRKEFPARSKQASAGNAPEVLRRVSDCYYYFVFLQLEADVEGTVAGKGGGKVGDNIAHKDTVMSI